MNHSARNSLIIGQHLSHGVFLLALRHDALNLFNRARYACT